MKDQPQTVQIGCNICAFIKHMHYTQCLFCYLYVFMLSLSCTTSFYITVLRDSSLLEIDC